MIHVVVGPPCAGKSTFVREHAEPGTLRVDFDAIATALGSPHPHDAPPAIRSAAFSARHAIIQEVLSGHDGDAWIIHTSPSRKQLNEYSEAGAQFHLLDPGIDTCLARVASDGRPDWTVDAITRWYESPPDLPEPAPKSHPTLEQLLAELRTLG